MYTKANEFNYDKLMLLVSILLMFTPLTLIKSNTKGWRK